MPYIRLVRPSQIASLALIGSALPLLLTGCGITPAQLSSTAAAGRTITGHVHGGQQSVVGSHIYLFAAATSGYGAPSVSLLDPTAPGVATDSIGSYVLTDSSGSFSVGGSYTCTPGQQVYIMARGGNPGLPGNTTNPALTLLAPLGTCPNEGTLAYQVPTLNLNEVSTVAAVYALSGFMTDPLHLSAPSTQLAQQGLANAFLTATVNLVDLPSGTAPGGSPAGNGFPPRATINTLANILAACVNSNGTGAACSTLFASAPNANGTLPTNTAAAALNIAHNPGANVTTLFNLGNASAPFQPTLTVAPNDWTVAITFYVEFMAGPYYPAFDAQGNLWIPGYANNTLTEIDPIGIPISGLQGYSGNGLSQPYAIAIDSAQTPWIANYAYNSHAVTSHFDANGSSLGNYDCGTNCTGIAIDSLQNIWTVAANGTTALHNSGVPLGQFSTVGTIPGVATDSTGHAWTIGANRNLNRLTAPATITTYPQTVTSTLANDLNLLAIDANDVVWFTSGKNNALGRFDPSAKTGTPATSFTGGGLTYPAQLAIDGANQVWVANRDGNSVSAFRNDGTPISPSKGYRPSGQVAPDPTVPITAVGIQSPHGLAIDGAGNVWVTNFTANSVTEIIGLATPTVTPLNPATHGQRP